MKTCFELLEVALELIKQRQLHSLHSKNNNKETLLSYKFQ